MTSPQFCPFVSSLSVNVSVLTLVMISVDRYKGDNHGRMSH